MTTDHKPALPGRRRDRARLVLSEETSDLTGLIPGTLARVDRLDTGQLIITPLPNQTRTRLLWTADYLQRQSHAKDLAEWAVITAYANRLPYDQVGPSGQKQRRQVEARTGIPRTWPHTH